MRRKTSIIRLPRSLQNRLEASARTLLNPQNGPGIDFTRPLGEAALLPPDSLTWRIFKNPIALLIGGIAAVILELAEPSVRTAVWEHSSFRKDPMARLQRTGLAAMVTVYGARSIAEPMIARVVQIHSKISGETPCGVAYEANDVRLLSWVQATAAFGFAEAYSRYVRPLDAEEFDVLYSEGGLASTLYGAIEAPRSNAELLALFGGMRDRLQASPIIFEFLSIMRATPGFPMPLCWMQKMLVSAAVEILPDWIRERLGLSRRYGLGAGQRRIVQLAGALSDRIILSSSPAAQSCVRLGLPMTHLYV
ncbi:MAG: oxygenase MpaB family protein [Steroidobacteraceae bacterium]